MKMFSSPFARGARVLATLGAGFFLVSVAPAQPSASSVDSRYLLVFDTSSAMKSRVPATQYVVERLFLSMMNGQFQPGDSVGVWAFDRKLRKGEFPLLRWLPQNAATIASDITNFVRLQRYSKSTRFDVIMPEINSLVQDSQRLTVLIFCDGDGEIKGTPYDNAINTILKQNERALSKSDETFIVVLRAQLGRYIGYTINSSAIGVNLPEFPPLPAPPQPVAPVQINPPPPPRAPSPPPVIRATPLIIIGTNVGTNPIPLVPPRAVLPNPPPARVESNPPPPAESLSNSTNAISTNGAPPKIAETQTNAPMPSGETSGLSRNGALAIGAGLLVAAVGLIILALFRSRKTSRGSLITRSMKKD
jgi:hypothetical protein